MSLQDAGGSKLPALQSYERLDKIDFIKTFWDFPGGAVVKTALPLQGVQFQSLIGEQRPHMLRNLNKKALAC